MDLPATTLFGLCRICRDNDLKGKLNFPSAQSQSVCIFHVSNETFHLPKDYRCVDNAANPLLAAYSVKPISLVAFFGQSQHSQLNFVGRILLEHSVQF